MNRRIVRAPIYQQLNQALRELLREGEFAEGDQFLTERQICERFDVSRATANKALSNLVAEGVLEFKKGVGTFVRGGVLDYDLRALVSFTDKATAVGKRPSTRLLFLETTPAREIPGDVAQKLRLRPENEVYYIERLRLADGMPVTLENRYVVAKYCPRLSKVELEGSLYAAWTETFKLEIAGADQVIRAVCLRSERAEWLQVEEGAPALQVMSVGYLSGGVPLWWERTLYRGDAYEFHNRLGPIQTARPAAGTLLDVGDQA
jgi:GntR family transcriptional regulator